MKEKFKEIMKDKKKVLVMALMLMVLVGLGTFTYAYFSSNINNDNNEKVTIQTGKAILELRDPEGSGLKLEKSLGIGESVTKELVLENKGTVIATAQIYWHDIVNSYITKSLEYKLYESLTKGGEYKEIEAYSTNVPHTEEAKDKGLSKGITLEPKEIRYYKVEVTLVDVEGINQTADFDSSLKTGFTIKEGNRINQVIDVGILNTENGSANLVMNDLTPKSASELSDDENAYTVVLSNTSSKDVEYELTMSDVSNTTIANNPEYSSYTALEASNYKYVNERVDGGEVKNLESVKSGDKFVIMSGTLEANSKAEEHTIQIFADNKDTTPDGAPDSMSSALLSLDATLVTSEVSEREENETLKSLKANAKTATPDFNTVATTDEGVYAMEDEDGTSYYFRGAVENNYVKFGKNSNGNDMYWRIIRINGNGTIRMIYDGTSAHENGEENYDRLALTDIPYNAQSSDNKYVGYMYGGVLREASTSKVQAQTNETDSNIKTVLEKWYEDNLAGTAHENYISDEVFCNDRSIPDITGDIFGNKNTKNSGYGKYNKTYYGTYNRIYNTFIPTFRCDMNTIISTKNDKFTISETKGNGRLKYPIGLITADEIMTAGGHNTLANMDYYLYKGEWYWSFSPRHYDSYNAYVFQSSYSGAIVDRFSLYESGGVAPVINLNADISKTLKGTGTATDPFRID